ncbi:unnamed protein product [Lymnaea stagnalis]|uniref:Uncharacterized protein n=1 Tax=Lymnaea stagnalis TaxID=6523 RepID=A0AAV2I4K2_LYMST
MFRMRGAMGFVTCLNFATCFFIIINMSSGDPLPSQQKLPLKDIPDHQTTVHHLQQIAKLMDLIMNAAKTVQPFHKKQGIIGVSSGDLDKVSAEIVSPEEAQNNPWTQPPEVTTENSLISRAETGFIAMDRVSMGDSGTESIIIDLLREYCYRLVISGAKDIPTYCYQVIQG